MSQAPQDPTNFPSTMAYRGTLPKAAPLERLAQYRILKQLGRGGMGVVYQAKDVHLDRMAALKVMRADYAADHEAVARFLREARAAAKLKHDHIVTIYQVGEENGVPFLAMEFLAGKSLEDWLKGDRQPTAAEVILISKQIARGLAAAHKAKLIHRDIKPANLWLEAPRGRVKILDFGLARLTAGEHTELTQDGSVLGTPAYMAPEQARGDAVDHRCDLFSLGCVMYRMLTGSLPFTGSTTFAVLSAIATHTPPSPASIRSEVPQRLSSLVDRLLAKQPDARPASAQAVLDELNEIEQQSKQSGSQPSLLSSPQVPMAILPVASPVARQTVPVASASGDTLTLAAPTVRVARPVRRKGKGLPTAWLGMGAGAGVLLLAVLLAILLNQPGRNAARQQTVAKGPASDETPSEPSNKTSSPTTRQPQREPEPTNPKLAPKPEVPLPSSTATPMPRPASEPASTTPSPAPMVVTPPTQASPLRPLSELNTTADETAPWVSPDGLEIYFVRESKGQGPQTFRATRAGPDAFGPASLVNSLRHTVLSNDGLVMVGLSDDGGSDRMFESVRASTADPFAAPKLIESLKNEPAPKSPWLSPDGKRLYYQRTDKVGDYAGKASPEAKRETEFVMCRRDSLTNPWSKPVRLPMMDDPLLTDALTWPALSGDGLTLFFCKGGTRSPEVMYATRTDPLKAFGNPQRIMVDGQPLLGRAPRYLAARHELIFSRNQSRVGETDDFDLCVLTGFEPQAARPTPDKKPVWPKDAVAFGGHHYKFFPEQTTWHAAKEKCAQAGGHLAIVDSAEENEFLGQLIQRGKGIDAWLGITDEAQEDKWLTVEGKPVTYTNWFTGQPNNKQKQEHYAVISGRVLAKEAFNWRWSDQPARALAAHTPGYLCEWTPAEDEEEDTDFTDLFDGKTLSGWEGDLAGFGIQNGLLVANGGRGILYTKGQYADFELRIEFRLSAGANNGLLIRSPRTPWQEASSQGNEIQILDDESQPMIKPWQHHGGLYGVLGSKTGHLKPAGQWNQQTVLCRGSKLRIVLNGEVILDADLSKLAQQPSLDGKPHPGLRNKQGYIGLMNHTNRVEFRKLQIKELK